MKTLSVSLLFVCLIFAKVDAQKPLLVKTFGGYTTGWEVQLLNYGKDNDVMIFDLIVTLKKGKEGDYGISRTNKGTRIITSDGTEYNDTWVSLGAKKSTENNLTFHGTAAFVYTRFSVDVPMKMQIRFEGVEPDDFSLLGFYIASYDNQASGFLCEFKRSEF